MGIGLAAIAGAVLFVASAQAPSRQPVAAASEVVSVPVASCESNKQKCEAASRSLFDME